MARLSGASAKSLREFTPSPSRDCSTRAGDRQRERAARILPSRFGAILRQLGRRVETIPSPTRMRSGHHQPRGARRSEPNREAAEEQRVDGRRGDDRPGDDACRSECRSRRHDSPSGRVAKPDDDRAPARSSGARIVDPRIGDRVTILNHCVITGSTIANDAASGPSLTCVRTVTSATTRRSGISSS